MTFDSATTATQVADTYLEELADLDPDAAQALGHANVIRIANLSPGAYAARNELDRRALAALERIAGEPPASAATSSDALLGAAMRERLASDILLDEVGFTRRLLAPLASPVHALRQVFDGMPREHEEDWQRIAEHLVLVPRALGEFRETLTQQAEAGNVVGRRQVLVVAGQCENWVGSEFYAGVAAAYEGTDAELRERLNAGAAGATAATAEFAAWLRADLAARASDVDGVGRAVYEGTSRAFLGAVVDLDELYAYGWAEIERLQTWAGELAVEIAGTPDVAEAVRVLDERADGRVAVGEPLRAWLQQRLDDTTDAVDGRYFDIPERTRAAEAQMTTAAAGVMYYSPPDAALTRPGRIWWTVPPEAESVATWREVSTVHHEGVPGHHLQHAITFGVDGLHPWQRLLCHVHGYAEGWAHYAEQLADEIGLVRDAGERLGMVFAQLWRACRIVIDIGLHLDLPIPAGAPGVPAGVTTWTPELGVQVLREVAEVDPTTAAFEVDRYLGWPGQALAFKVGARLWQQVRADVATGLGADFDLREFHMAALRLGPMGLGPLREALISAFGIAETPR